MNSTWPTARLNCVDRLRVLRGVLHAPVYAETHFDMPIDRVWSVAADLEREVPRLIWTVRSFDLLPAQDTHIPAVAVGRTGRQVPFEITLEPGWCLMQGRRVVGGMAAVSEGGGTRFAVLGGGRGPQLRLRRALFSWAGARMGGHILRTLGHDLAEAGAGEPPAPGRAG